MILFEQLGELQKALWQQGTIVAPQQIILERKPKETEPETSQSLTLKSTLKSLKPLEKSKRPYRVAVPHTWRTRKDPLEGSTDYAYLMFQLHPDITSSELFYKQREKFPEKFTGGELKTVQRRLSLWRRQSMRITMLSDDTAYGAQQYQLQVDALTEKALDHSVESG